MAADAEQKEIKAQKEKKEKKEKAVVEAKEKKEKRKQKEPKETQEHLGGLEETEEGVKKDTPKKEKTKEEKEKKEKKEKKEQGATASGKRKKLEGTAAAEEVTEAHLEVTEAHLEGVLDNEETEEGTKKDAPKKEKTKQSATASGKRRKLEVTAAAEEVTEAHLEVTEVHLEEVPAAAGSPLLEGPSALVTAPAAADKTSVGGNLEAAAPAGVAPADAGDASLGLPADGAEAAVADAAASRAEAPAASAGAPATPEELKAGASEPRAAPAAPPGPPPSAAASTENFQSKLARCLEKLHDEVGPDNSSADRQHILGQFSSALSAHSRKDDVAFFLRTMKIAILSRRKREPEPSPQLPAPSPSASSREPLDFPLPPWRQQQEQRQQHQQQQRHRSQQQQGRVSQASWEEDTQEQAEEQETAPWRRPQRKGLSKAQMRERVYSVFRTDKEKKKLAEKEAAEAHANVWGLASGSAAPENGEEAADGGAAAPEASSAPDPGDAEAAAGDTAEEAPKKLSGQAAAAVAAKEMRMRKKRRRGPDVNVDAIYDMGRLLHKTHPILDEGRKLNVENLKWFADQMLELSNRTSHWEVGWIQMGLPEEMRTEVGAALVKCLLKTVNEFPTKEQCEKVGTAIGDLCRGHRVKMSTLQTTLCFWLAEEFNGAREVCADAWSIIARMLFHLFPQSQEVGWGWSRIGWSWLHWWRFALKLLDVTVQDGAFDILRGTLAFMQDEEDGRHICQQEQWASPKAVEQQRLAQLHQQLLELSGGLEGRELQRKLGEVRIWEGDGSVSPPVAVDDDSDAPNVMTMKQELAEVEGISSDSDS